MAGRPKKGSWPALAGILVLLAVTTVGVVQLLDPEPDHVASVLAEDDRPTGVTAAGPDAVERPPGRDAAGPTAASEPEPEAAAPIAAEVAPEPGWLTGRVTAEGGIPVPGAEVTLGWSVDERRRGVGTNHDGRYRMELAALREPARSFRGRRGHSNPRARLEQIRGLEEWLRRQKRRGASDPEKIRQMEGILANLHARPADEVVVEARASGYQLESRRLLIDLDRQPAMQVDFVLRRGATLRGRVVDANGLGVGGATVNLVGQDLSLIRGTLTDPGGGYELGFGAQGLYHLHARLEGRGAACLVDLGLTPLVAIAVPDLVLVDGGSLAGDVRDPGGKAIPGLALEVVPEEYAHLVTMTIPFSRLVEAEMDGGLFHARSGTDDKGHFEVAGLRLGRYAVRFPDQPDAAYQPGELFAVTQVGLDLVFYGHLLHVQPIDGEGRPHPFATVTCARIERRSDGTEHVGAALARRPSRGCSYATFFVRPDERYVIRARAPGSLEDVDVVRVVPGRWQVFTDLHVIAETDPGATRPRLRDPAVTGRIEVHARTADGEALEGFGVRLATEESGSLLSGFVAAKPDAAGRVSGVPPGRYRLSLVPFGASSSLARELAHEEVVAVHLGRTTTVTVSAPQSGRLVLATRVAGEPHEPRDEDLDEPAPDDDTLDDLLDLRGIVARVFVPGVRRFRKGRTVQFEPLGDADRTDGRRLLAGSSARCSPSLQPGTWTLRLESPLLDEHRDVKVEILPGETTTVEVEIP